ncbi:MAG: HpcH/HpaI aldolase family protein [Burkholderiales bacterium]
MSAYPNRAKSRLAAGELALGMVLRQARTVDIAALAVTAGFDWFSIDMEHSTIDVDTAAQIVCAALPAGITPLVRVPGEASHHASRLLDAGAQGIIFPHINSPEDARRAVAQCLYPPMGTRSYAGIQAQLAFRSTPVTEATRQVNEQTLVVAMLESVAAIDHAEAIAAVPGVNALLIGINDLCDELGVPGKFGDPKVEEAFARVIAACAKHRVSPGMSGVHDPVLAKKYISMGMRFIGGGTDQSFLMAGASQRAAFLRGLL